MLYIIARVLFVTLHGAQPRGALCLWCCLWPCHTPFTYRDPPM